MYSRQPMIWRMNPSAALSGRAGSLDLVNEYGFPEDRLADFQGREQARVQVG